MSSYQKVISKEEKHGHELSERDQGTEGKTKRRHRKIFCYRNFFSFTCLNLDLPGSLPNASQGRAEK